MSKKKLDLVKIIKDNPGCRVVIDNDCWFLYAKGSENDDDPTPLIDSGDNFKHIGDGGYGSGNCYGGDILQALSVIVGITIESV